MCSHLVLCLGAGLVVGVSVGRPLAAQVAVRVELQVEPEFDSNVFLLSNRQRSRLTSPPAGVVTSGRYANMESATDVIVVTRGGIELVMPGVDGRDLSFYPEVRYEANMQNAERRNGQFGLEVKQDLPRDGRLRLDAKLTPGYFARNYLEDATDANGDLVISPDETRYTAGRYGAGTVELDYRHRLNKSTKSSPFGAALRIAAGYESQAYDAPFTNRDFRGPTGALAVLLQTSRRTSLDLIYDLAVFEGSPGPQVMLVDEADAGQDLNGNGFATDQGVRVAGRTDRGRTEHAAGIRFGSEMTRRADLRLAVENRWRAFSSTEPNDYQNHGRRDMRTEAGADVSLRLGRGTRLLMGVRGATQRIERARATKVDEVADYNRFRASVGIRHRF